jgi:hypothetical protein
MLTGICFALTHKEKTPENLWPMNMSLAVDRQEVVRKHMA